MQQSLITIIIPVLKDKASAIENELDRLNNPASTQLRYAFGQKKIIHFMSGALVHGEKNRDHLVFEISADGTQKDVLALFDEAAGLETLFDPLFKVIGQEGKKSSFLKDHIEKAGTGYFSTPGLSFSGTPGMRVERILKDQQLARGIRKYLEDYPPTGSSLKDLGQIKDAMEQDDYFTKPGKDQPSLKSLLSDEASPILEGEKNKPTHPAIIAKIIGVTVFTLMWPMFIIAALITYLSLPALAMPRAWYGALSGALAFGVSAYYLSPR